MATLLSPGGRYSGSNTVTLDTVQRTAAQNPVSTPNVGPSGTLSVGVPTLNAAAADRIFDFATERDAWEQTGQGETLQTQRTNRGPVNSVGALSQSPDEFARQMYRDLGWDLGWNTAATRIARGAEAFGLRENINYSRMDEQGNVTQSGNRWQNLEDIARSANLQVENYRNPDGSLNETALKSAVDIALKDYYVVSGDSAGLPGYANPEPFKYVSSIYKREGDSLVPIAGTQQTFKAPQNSAGHFAEELAPVLSVLFAPITQGLGLLGTGGAITSAISNTTGLSPFWSNLVGSSVVRGGMTALSGGDFLQGAVQGAVGAGAAPLISQGADALAGAGTTGADFLNAAGRIGLNAALSGGNITPMGAVSTIIDSFGRGNQRTRK